jgi:uncharacterized SAM-binding protein YcdF (DUF218 family)
MSCTSGSSASRSVLRWLLLPFTLAVLATLIALRVTLKALSLRKRTPAASTRAPERPLAVMTPGDREEALDDAYTAFWLEALSGPYAQASCIQHLNRCLTLDPARHDH